MKWLLLTSCLCSLSLLVVGRAIPAKRRAGHHSAQEHGSSELADIILNEEQKYLLKEANLNGKRAIIADLSNSGFSKPWTNGTIPYVMDPKIIGSQYEKSFNKAMRTWQKHTCINFVKRTNEDSYVILTNHTSGCNSGVGMWTNDHYPIYLAEHCSTPGNAMHELGHAIGFHHMHQRPDRDGYIKMKYDNLDDSDAAVESYKILEKVHLSDFGVEYDYASVMHYGRDAFVKKENLDAFELLKDLPECLQNAELDVGQRVTISSKDIEQANKLYKCPEKPTPSLCELLSPQEEDRKKNIKIENKISLGLIDDGSRWVTCLPGNCSKKSCNAGFDDIKRFGIDMCTHHQFTIRTTVTREKVKVGDTITLEGKPGQFLDCTSEGGFCSTTQCDKKESSRAGSCSNHVFRITSEGKEIGDIVQTHDFVHLQYVDNEYYLDCSGAGCMVHPVVCNKELDKDQTSCKLPSFVIQK